MAADKVNPRAETASTIEKGRLELEDSTITSKEYLLAAIVDSADDAIVTKTLQGIITFWNRGAQKIYGYSAEEATGKPISLLTPPGHEDEVSAILERINHGETIYNYETVRMRKDGKVIDVAITISPIKDREGRIVGGCAIARDITAAVAARKKVEEKLSTISAYSRSLIESSLDPLVTISPEGKITDVNEATIKVTGISREQLIGTDFSNYFTEPEKAREGYQQVFANGFVTDYPLTIRHKDGRLTDVLYNASVYKDTQGKVSGVFAAARDVTARKRIEQELDEQRQRELERLSELERFQKLTVGRELKMVELKKEIADLKAECERWKRKAGEPA